MVLLATRGPEVGLSPGNGDMSFSLQIGAVGHDDVTIVKPGYWPWDFPRAAIYLSDSASSLPHETVKDAEKVELCSNTKALFLVTLLFT